MNHYDAIIVGGGIAGASLAAELAPLMSVLILEMEAQPGYHTTGRSNAFWHATYGGPGVEPLTSASLAWLQSPPVDVSPDGFLSPRGAITLAHADAGDELDRFVAGFSGSSIALERIDRAALALQIPGLRADWQSAVLERGCFDIDVARLHGAYLAAARRSGAVLACRQSLTLAKQERGIWHVETRDAAYSGGLLINAAGAWADEVARIADVRPLGIQPFRRTIMQIAVDAPVPADLPLVIDIAGSFYFKPDNGQIWLSPHDEIPSDACDAAPDELDVALAIDRFEKVVDWPVRRVVRRWAGLRSFAPDRLPVYGHDPVQQGFFWCAGQGGFGIQTAPAAAKLCASLITGKPRDPLIASLDAEIYKPRRLVDAISVL
jgi:D-arginine dehydrogenase